MGGDDQDWWIVLLVRHAHSKVERPLEETEQVLRLFKVPSVGEVVRALDWLVANGADADFSRLAIAVAMGEAIELDREWLAALHLVVNRRVRENAVGWAGYYGNWVELVEAVKQIAESEEGEQS